MALEGLIGNLAQVGAQLPLNYGQMYQGAYQPGFNYYNNQAGNMAQLGNTMLSNTAQLGGQGMNLYGNLAGQQTSMYQSELPFRMEQAQFNALAPMLGGLLGNLGLGSMPQLSPINVEFNRPDVMAGYQPAVNMAYDKLGSAYGQANADTRSYDRQFNQLHAGMMDRMPTAPYMRPQDAQGQPAYGAPAPAVPAPAPKPKAPPYPRASTYGAYGSK